MELRKWKINSEWFVVKENGDLVNLWFPFQHFHYSHTGSSCWDEAFRKLDSCTISWDISTLSKSRSVSDESTFIVVTKWFMPNFKYFVWFFISGFSFNFIYIMCVSTVFHLFHQIDCQWICIGKVDKHNIMIIFQCNTKNLIFALLN